MVNNKRFSTLIIINDLLVVLNPINNYMRCNQRILTNVATTSHGNNHNMHTKTMFCTVSGSKDKNISVNEAGPSTGARLDAYYVKKNAQKDRNFEAV